MKRKPVILNENVFDMIPQCKEEYLKHHPEMKEVPISNNKILFEVMKHYLKKGLFT